jgi:hypothetical protein
MNCVVSIIIMDATESQYLLLNIQFIIGRKTL